MTPSPNEASDSADYIRKLSYSGNSTARDAALMRYAALLDRRATDEGEPTYWRYYTPFGRPNTNPWHRFADKKPDPQLVIDHGFEIEPRSAAPDGESCINCGGRGHRAYKNCKRCDGSGKEPSTPSDASSATTLCPNCVSPWKCNGPHIGDAPPHGYEGSSATSEAVGVPREPTKEMMECLLGDFLRPARARDVLAVDHMANAYRAMIARIEQNPDNSPSNSNVIQQNTDKSPAASALANAGVYLNADCFDRWLNDRDFWDKQPHGTRWYWGDGLMDYIHRGILEAAIKLMATHPAQQQRQPQGDNEYTEVGYVSRLDTPHGRTTSAHGLHIANLPDNTKLYVRRSVVESAPQGGRVVDEAMIDKFDAAYRRAYDKAAEIPNATFSDMKIAGFTAGLDAIGKGANIEQG